MRNNNDGFSFRAEVLATRSGKSLGELSLAQPMSSWIIVSFAMMVTCSIVAIIFMGDLDKKARVSGITVPTSGLITVAATGAGTLKESFVTEGQTVKAGQRLFEVVSERQVHQGEISDLVNQQIRIRLSAVQSEKKNKTDEYFEKQRALDSRLNNLRSELDQLTDEMDLMLRRQAFAIKSVNNFEKLEKSGFVSTAQTQQKQEDLIDIKARISALVRTRSQLNDTMLGLRAERKLLSNDLSSSLSQFEEAEATLKQELAENLGKHSTFINAPKDGTITSITNQIGQSVTAGQILASVILNNSAAGKDLMEVNLYTPSRTAGFVSPGQNVLIRYQSYPYQKFGLYKGTIYEISSAPIAPNELPANVASTILSNAQQSTSGFNGNEALYRIKVRLEKQSIESYGTLQRIRPGLTLEADIIQEKRKIWEWIFDPILAIKKSAN